MTSRGPPWITAISLACSGRLRLVRLRELAIQDRRNVDSGHVQAYIRDDDELRAAILDLIGENGEPAGT